MTALSLDASVALCWCFEDEASEATDRVLRMLQSTTAAVPTHWHIEVANVLALAERRRRITLAEQSEFIELLTTLAIDVDDETPGRAFGRALSLARSERLTCYDAAYLELAMRLGIPLATRDEALSDAALRLGVDALCAD